MGTTKVRAPEDARVRDEAIAVLQEQGLVLEHVGLVLRDAARRVEDYARVEVEPRVRNTMSKHVTPVVAGSVAATTAAVAKTKKAIRTDVLPAVSHALERVGDAAGKVRRETVARAESLAKASGVKTPAPTPGPGRYILIGLGVVAVAGLAYAVWQTMRADDDLWIEEEPDPLEEDFAATDIADADSESETPAATI